MELSSKINPHRTILHCDCNGYYASVECLLRPELRNLPMAVTGNPENRHGIILAKNQLAKEAGVITAETISEAKRKCPDLICVSPHHDLYQEYSIKINNIYREYTERVEPFGIDESFLDMTDLWQNYAASPAQFADLLRKRIRESIGLTISVGVSFNKILAKLGSDFKKPDATTVILPEDLTTKVWPLDITNLLYVGKVTAERLRILNINTIGDIAKTDPDFLASYLGKIGENLSLYARGLENSEVQKYSELDEAKSIGNGMTFSEDLTGWEKIREGLSGLVDEVVTRLIKSKKVCNVIQVQLKSSDFQIFSRQTTLNRHIQKRDQVWPIVWQLINELWDETTPIRLLAVTVSGLENQGEVYTQMSFADIVSSNLSVADDSNKSKNSAKQDQIKNLIFELNQQMGGDFLKLGRNQ
ncbi:MAG TPA: DNA polymerase IV [Clostridiaceae bacterium]|nr:DNA polymerase IV [Clostridiaceae bacterium]